VRAVRRGEPFQTLPFVRPGGDILLKLDGWPKVERVLQPIDAIERLGIDPGGLARPLAARPQPNDRRPGTSRLHADQHHAYLGCAGGSSHDAAGLILATVLAAMGVGYPGLTPMPIKLIWNASASAPIGFYSIAFEGPFEVTDLVAVDAPEPLATFIAERGYLPKGVPLLKRILAVSGQTVCRSNLAITVDGVEMSAWRSTAIALAAIFRSGRAAAASRPAKSSS
jgi:type IV secretory pathway protease TraF